MSYLYDKRKKIKKRKGVLLGLLILVLLFTPAIEYLYDILEKPFARAHQNFDVISDEFNRLVDIRQFSKEELIEYTTMLQDELQRLRSEKEYNQFYIDRFATSQVEGEMVFANILDRSLLNKALLTLNKGSQDGFHVGDQVFAFDYILIGELVDVFDTTSRMLLYSDTTQSLEGVLFPHDIPVTLEGFGSTQYHMQIDRSVPVQPGDIVYSSALSGYSLAVVRDVEFDPRDPFKHVILTARANIHELTYVQVLKNTADTL